MTGLLAQLSLQRFNVVTVVALVLNQMFTVSESVNEAGDPTAANGMSVQVKEEEEETEEEPAVKRKRGQSKSQTKTKDMPKEEIKSEGNV